MYRASRPPRQFRSQKGCYMQNVPDLFSPLGSEGWKRERLERGDVIPGLLPPPPAPSHPPPRSPFVQHLPSPEKTTERRTRQISAARRDGGGSKLLLPRGRKAGHLLCCVCGPQSLPPHTK
ncbi:Hypothetical predicted protein [Podarcis lilfordi]|uniref:Uncharacterized protein n=1 Tax=Podarcis lilfordi TaxID=74358 RepID=A0AA35PSR2_9SAUR|nr:Hypothetical predicted protein [Podarcis lilfordi]